MLPSFRADWAFFLDLDGTLIEIADHPDDVEMCPGLLSTLESLYRRLGGAVALVSGRTLESLDEILAPLRLPAAGLHGHVRRDAVGRVTREEGDREALGPVRRRFAAFVSENPGSFVEDKGASLALHYRGAPSAAAAAERFRDALASDLSEGLRLQPGKMVIEVKPDGESKGTAIAAFMQEEPFRGRTPVFLGDDATDEAGFCWVNARGGVSVKVGAGTTTARFRVDDVRGASAWLQSYDRFLEGSP